MQREAKLEIDTGRVRLWLWVMIGMLAGTSLAGQYVIHTLNHDELEDVLGVMDVDAEGNVPSWFSAGLLMWASVLARGISCAHKGVRHGRNPGGTLLQSGLADSDSGEGKDNDRAGGRWGWLGLSAVLAVLSIDEIAQFHEQLGRLGEIWEGHGLLYYIWVVPAMGIAAGTGLVFLPWLLKLPRRTAWGLIRAGLIFVCGAVGMEAVCAWHAEALGMNNFEHSMLATIEETLEMGGVSMAIVALMQHWATEIGPVELRVTDGR